MSKRIQIYAIIVGVVFLLSGFGKALSMADFTAMINRYGVPFPLLAALCIVITETVLGLLLFFHLCLRKVSVISIMLILCLSLIFLYGHFFVNINDCGCFGAFSFLNMPAIYTFLRNIVLLYLLINIFVKSKKIAGSISFVERIAFMVVMSVVSFFAGYTSESEYLTFHGKGKYESKMVQNTKLGEFITTSADSTYFVFVFSYSCRHCLNSIENLKQYEPAGVVDKVIALAMDSPQEKENFQIIFTPNFEIIDCDPIKLLELTAVFPSAYYIKNNTIQLELTGELPCGYVLEQANRKMDKKR